MREQYSQTDVFARQGPEDNSPERASALCDDIEKKSVKKPFTVIPAALMYDVEANVNGGGLHGQADAVKLGISRALLKSNEDWRAELRAEGLLTVDARVKERKKPGQKGARRKFQFVKR